MGRRGREMVVGIVFFATLTTLGFFSIIIGNFNPFNPPRKLWIYFDEVAGLRTGNVVRVNGLEVGQVDRMILLQQGGVMARAQMNPRVTVHPNYKVRIKAFSPLGGKFVDLYRGNTVDEKLTLPEAEPVDKETKITGVLDKDYLRGSTEAEFISELADLAEKVKPMVISAVANINEVTAKVNSMQGTLGRLVGDPAMYNHLRNAAKNLEETTESVNKVLGKINEGNGTLAKLVNDGRLYDTTVKTLERVESIAGKVDEGRGTFGALFNDNAMRDNVARSVSRVASLLVRVDEGEGTLGQVVRNDRLYKALSAALEDISKVTGEIAQAKGPLGVLISDRAAGESVKKTLTNVAKMTDAVVEGKGTLGRLFMDDRLITEAERVVVEIRESVEDLREQAPINAFVQAVFQAF